jgi:hypothetical protein
MSRKNESLHSEENRRHILDVDIGRLVREEKREGITDS